jgi:NADPH-dependent 2,4-dienoyl-CoA reductase/sulfur reductase-like enzyme
MSNEKRKTMIIGGVAGGASCAARLRRLDGEREIVLLERGPYISYANCGLPYHVGNVIRNRNSLLLMTPELMAQRFRVDVRVRHEAVAIHRETKTVTIRELETGREYEESYDDLVIATGSSPLRPKIPGIDSERIRTLWTVPDTDAIRALVQSGKLTRAAVIGGGFIGLEMAENLAHAGLDVSLIEAMDQVMAPLDPEMAQLLHENIRKNGVHLHLSDGVAAFEDDGSRVTIRLNSGKALQAELVILSIGVRPNSRLAREAGLPLSDRGGILVDEHLRTEDPSIYAVGDVYITTREGDPAELLGYGAWDRIQGRFLLAADPTHPPGTRGGEAAHALQPEELPAGARVLDPENLSLAFETRGSGSLGHLVSSGADLPTRSLGGGQPFNLFPPYIALYVWVRKS